MLPAHSATVQPTLPSFSSVAEILHERTQSAETILADDTTYFIGEEDVFLFYEAVFAFDSAICLLPYGSQVSVRKLGGRWAHVRTDIGEGWILKDSLRADRNDVFPVLVDTVTYAHEHPETKKLRRIISDTFYGEQSLLPLTDVEFVTYRLGESGKRIPWSFERPRVSGTWQRLLRGKEGIHITIVPKAGSVMEYTHEDIGHVAYVESVFPDESIAIASVGLINEGEYTTTVLTHDVWRELRPVFINII